jgi:hypothetical protein
MITFIGIKRVKNFLSYSRDFRKGDIYHPAAVFSYKSKKGKEKTFIIPLTTYRSNRQEVRVATTPEGHDIVVDTSTHSSRHKAHIVSEVIIKDGRFDTRGFYLESRESYRKISEILFGVIKSGQMAFHTNFSLNDIKMTNVQKGKLEQDIADSIKKYWIG